MKIKVTNIVEEGESKLTYFACKIGQGLSCWKGKHHLTVNDEYNIEFSIEENIKKGVNAFPSDSKEPFIRSDGNTILLNGYIDSIEEDDVAYFRLAEDCLIMVEISSDNLEQGEWLTLKCDARQVGIYPH